MRARYDTELLPEGVRATEYSVDGAMVPIGAKMIRTGASCPDCGYQSAHRHGHYVRSLADLPAHGRAVRVRLSVRRFRSMTTRCPKTLSARKFPLLSPDAMVAGQGVSRSLCHTLAAPWAVNRPKL